MKRKYNLDLMEGKDFRVKRDHWLPKRLNVDWFVFGKTMYCRLHGGGLPKHEFLHLAQFEKHGIVVVMVHYIYHGVKNLVRYRKLSTAFQQIPFEVEAKAFASDSEQHGVGASFSKPSWRQGSSVFVARQCRRD